MRDSLEFLFRQRFKEHEAPVDPGMWQAIQGKMAAGVPGTSNFEDLVKERFESHEMAVDPSIWGNISAQLGHGALAGTAAGGGASALLGWAAAGIGVITLVGGLYFFGSDDPGPTPGDVAAIEAPARTEPLVIEPLYTEPESKQEEPASSITTTASLSDPVQRTSNILDPAPTTLAANNGPSQERAIATVETIAPNEIAPTPGEVLVQKIITDLTEQVKEDVLSKTGTTPASKPPINEAEATGIETVPEIANEPVLREPSLFLQNTFTPNGDGINDEYVVSTEGFERMIIKVFSVKTNQLVFSTNTNEPWTGDRCEDGYYLLAVEAMTRDGRLVSKGQVVWLNRNPQN